MHHVQRIAHSMLFCDLHLASASLVISLGLWANWAAQFGQHVLHELNASVSEQRSAIDRLLSDRLVHTGHRSVSGYCFRPILVDCRVRIGCSENVASWYFCVEI